MSIISKVILILLWLMFGFRVNSQVGSPSIKIIDTLLHFEKQFSTDTNTCVYFFGELHNYKYNEEIAMECFQILKKSNGVNNFCFEGGPSTEYLFYYYLKHGSFEIGGTYDLKILLSKKYVKSFVMPFSDFCKRNDSIKYFCYDLESDLYNAIIVLRHILVSSDKSYLFTNEIQKTTNPGVFDAKLYEQCEYMLNNYKADSLKYIRGLMPNELYYYKRIINLLQPSVNFNKLIAEKKYALAFNYREPFIKNNLLEQFANKKEKFFVQIGINHLRPNSMTAIPDGFVNILQFKELTELKYKKIGCTYSNMNRYENNWLLEQKEIKRLKRKTNKKYTYFNLNELKTTLNTDFDYLIFCKP